MKIKSVKQNRSRNPWINFYSNYAAQRKAHTIPTKKKSARGAVMKEAAQRWKSMSDTDKSAYKYDTKPASPYQFKFTSIWQNLNKFLNVLRRTHKSGATADCKTIVQSKNDLRKWQNQVITELDKKY